jgi:hypothetical protein
MYSCCFLVFLGVRFLSLFLAFQQAQVHQKWNLYASSFAFSSLDIFTVSWRWEAPSLKSSKNIMWAVLLFIILLGFYSSLSFQLNWFILIGVLELCQSEVLLRKLCLRGFWHETVTATDSSPTPNRPQRHWPHVGDHRKGYSRAVPSYIPTCQP